jgi:hypothetical protein
MNQRRTTDYDQENQETDIDSQPKHHATNPD